ncbi:hypothetical protein B0H13DRAFT_1466614, partial [Mycena leptocephala]
LLQDQALYQRLLACQGRDAQTLLDLLQDVSNIMPLILKALLRLSRESDLHPRCFVLPELHKVGNQVAAGGSGDLWKGLVREVTISVRIMRVFEDSDVQAILNKFSREALIWRQLAHPNVLPFFGVYYLQTRLCLVPPWMENGNIMKFLE